MLCTLRAGRSRAGCCEIVATTRGSRGVPKSPRKREREIFSNTNNSNTLTHHLGPGALFTRALLSETRAERE